MRVFGQGMSGFSCWLKAIHVTIALCLSCLQLFAGGTVATAQEGTAEAENDPFARSFLFHPASTGVMTVFDVEINAGDSMELTVLVGNSGTVTQDLRIYPINVFTGEGGGMAAADYGTSPNSVTSWVDFPEEVLTLEPGVGYEKTFAVRVPPNTPPGEYIAAVAAEHANAYDIEGVETIRQRTRFVTPILITVPGEMSASFSFGDPSLEVQSDVLVIRVPIANTGSMHVKPTGEVTIRDQNGETIATAPIEMQTIYARESATLTLGIPGGLPPGQYELEGSFADERTGAAAEIGPGTFTAEVAATPVPEQFRITSATVTAGPASGAVQFVTVTAGIVNAGDPATGVQLSLIASLDGEEVERFPINQSLSLPTGETPITTRYIPATGFTDGEWSFELVLETVSSSGAAIVVARTTIEETVVISN